MAVLLDSSVLVAGSLQGHVHYDVADTWLASLDGSFATCPITQGSLLRAALRADYSMADASGLLDQITASDLHEFWPDDLDYSQVRLTGILGHRQVTDAYLAQLARQHEGRVATLDRGFAALHKDVADLIPTT